MLRLQEIPKQSSPRHNLIYSMSSVKEQDLMQLKKRLAVSLQEAQADDIVEALNSLDRIEMNVQLLARFKLVPDVKKFKTHSHAGVKQAATALFQKWKSLVKPVLERSKSNGSQQSKSNGSQPSINSSPGPRNVTGPATSSTPSTQAPKREADEAGQVAVVDDLSKLGQTGDKMRNNVQKRIFDALGDPPAKVKIGRVNLAIEIEAAMASHFADVSQYKEKYRELSSNLKDPTNIDLNRSLYSRHVSAKELITWDYKKLASESLKQQRTVESKEAIEAARSDFFKGRNSTDTFRCGKCGKRRCTFYQKQTRSADEPMTTFITCLECNNAWRE